MTSDGKADAGFAVIRSGPGWRVIHNGISCGLFDYQVDAVEAALRLARKLAAPGEAVDILVQERWGGLTNLHVA